MVLIKLFRVKMITYIFENMFRGRVSDDYEKSFIEGMQFFPPEKTTLHRALRYEKEHN